MVLISAIHHHESATGLQMSPPSWTSLPPATPTPLGCHRALVGAPESVLHTVVCVLPCCALGSPRLRPSVRKSVPCVCVPVAALHTGSSGPSLDPLCVLCWAARSCLIWRHCGLQPARRLGPWDSPGKNTGVGCPFPSLGNIADPGIEPRSPALQADSSPTELDSVYMC